jgi:hypothetical protein
MADGVSGTLNPMPTTAAPAGHVEHATTHPKFLFSNSTSHSWAFGAIAELVDNAQDPDVMADTLTIDCLDIGGHVSLRLADNGLGLDRKGLHRMLSFGHSEKAAFEAGRHQAVGRYGNGFKSGSMRLGEDALVCTRCATSQSVGLLSQTFLRAIDAQEILVPMVSWDLQGERLWPEDELSVRGTAGCLSRDAHPLRSPRAVVCCVVRLGCAWAPLFCLCRAAAAHSSPFALRER